MNQKITLTQKKRFVKYLIIVLLVALIGSFMNTLDIIIIVILSFCLIRGIFRGFAKELSSIIGVFGGLYAACAYYPSVSNMLSGFISDFSYCKILSFLIIFCSVFFVISILGVLIKYILKIAFMGWFDRLCGAGFGIVKGLLIVSVLLLAFTSFLPRGAPVIKESQLSPHVSHISEAMAKVVPKDMKNKFAVNIEGLKKAWKKHN